MELKVGEVIDGKYRIVRMLGKGGMGAVYEGEHTRIHRRVAIKVLHAQVAENETSVRRFEREAQAAGRIGSEHIVEVYDLGELADGDHFMVMEYLEGESLKDLFKRTGPLSPQEVFPVIIDLLTGLAAAHRAGIIHRDLKPANVFLVTDEKGRTDFVKILDFGVSKFLRLGSEGMEMTGTGTVVGTPYYMSPEQAKAERAIDFRADLFSVGVILYKGLSGRVPFKADTFAQLVLKVVLEDTPSITTLVAGVDPMVAAIVAKATARDPESRYATADEFAHDLRQWLEIHPESSRPPVLLARDSSIPPSSAATRQATAVTHQASASTRQLYGGISGGVEVEPSSGPALSTMSQVSLSSISEIPGVPKPKRGLVYALSAAALFIALGAGVGVVVMRPSADDAQGATSGVAAGAPTSGPDVTGTMESSTATPEASAVPSADGTASATASTDEKTSRPRRPRPRVRSTGTPISTGQPSSVASTKPTVTTKPPVRPAKPVTTISGRPIRDDLD